MNKMMGTIFLLSASFIWGIAYIPTRYLGSQNVSVFLELLVRYSFPLIIFGIYSFKDIKNIEINNIKKSLLVGLILFLALTLSIYGIRKIQYGSMGLLLISLNVIIVPLYFIVAKKKHISIILLISSLMSMLGIILLTTNNFKLSIDIGVLLCFLASICYSAYIILCSKILNDSRIKPAVLQFLQSLVFVIICSVLVLSDIKSLKSIDFTNINLYISFIFIGLFAGTIGYYLYFYGQKKSEPTIVALILASQTIFSAISEVIIFQIRPTIIQILSYTIIMLSIFIASSKDIKFFNKKTL